jgi:VWFA-related protein
MAGIMLAAFLLAQERPATAPGTEIRALTVSFLDEKGAPVLDLAPTDVALVENGVARDVVSFKVDRRPLSVAVLLDSSEAIGASFRLSLVEPVVSFVTRLPEGTRYALWTTGDRPTRVLDFTEDPSLASEALKRVVPQGGNRMLDALPEAARDLERRAREGSRTVVVAVSGLGPELSDLDRIQVAEAAGKAAELFLIVRIEEGEADFDTRTRISYVFDQLVEQSGGRQEVVLSPMAVDGALRRLSAVLRGGYRLSYATATDLKRRKLELRVARPGTKVLLPVAADPVP